MLSMSKIGQETCSADIFTTGGGFQGAMAKRSWPCGVACWEDTIKFAQLVFGLDVPLLNSSDRLPYSSDKSFLLFGKGACAEGKPLRKIADLIQPQLEEIEEWNKIFVATAPDQTNRSKCLELMEGRCIFGVHRCRVPRVCAV